MNQFNIIKIYIIFTQQQDINSIPIDYKPEDTRTYPGTENKVQKSQFKDIEIIQSLFFYHCGIMLEINIKRYLKIIHIFSSAM